MKRSLQLTLALMGTTVLAGCGSSEEVLTFKSLEQCKASDKVADATCESAYQQAEKQALKEVKYTNKAACETDFGAGQCQTGSGGSSNSFVPFMAGFMVSQMIDSDGRRSSSYAYRPLYTTSKDRRTFITGAGSTIGKVSNVGRPVKMSSSTVRSAAPAKASTKAITLSRGGFSARGGFGG